ncbi:MAG: MarR family transcriptional regulator [Acidobacteria bacterium]|nr:MAG: MarR family transcriptional regulator [Acidobacteriota bacterium]
MLSGHQIAMALRAGYLTMHRQTQAQLAEIGVTADQFVVLSVLAERDGITQQELVRRASSDPNTMRSMLVLLERRGFVGRERHPTDGRARFVTLTPAGREMQERILNLLQPLQERLLSLFDASEADHLVDLLARISTI